MAGDGGEDGNAEVAGDGGEDADADAPATRHSAVDDTGTAETTTRRPLAAPAVRARARDLGIDLASVAGSGPDGRILHADLDRLLVVDDRDHGRLRAEDDAVATPVRGVRRRIAARLSDTWQRVPHITYVEAVDATELQRLREALNRETDGAGGRLTILPFIARAMVIAGGEQPGINAHYDHEHETLTEHAAVHIGIATQTDAGLLVPVVRHAEARGLRDLASEIARVTAAARDGSATRHELAGSTITITSLGAIGGIATTPIINAPEVAIVGVNKLETRPVWRAGSFQPRELFNLSCSFDHRMVDGWDAAVFVQRLKALLETPALLFVGDG